MQNSSSFERSIELYHDKFSRIFGRKEVRNSSRDYLKRLIYGNPAIYRGQMPTLKTDSNYMRSVQRFLADTLWRHEDLIEEVQKYVIESLNKIRCQYNLLAICTVGTSRRGKKILGAEHLYSSESYQQVVLACLITNRGCIILDGSVYLPSSIEQNQNVRISNKIPRSVVYKSEKDIAIELIRKISKTLPNIKWVTMIGDVESERDFYQEINKLNLYYVNYNHGQQVLVFPNYPARERKI